MSPDPAVQRIAIVGAGGHGREQLDLMRAANAAGSHFAVEGFVVDPEFARAGESVSGLPVLGGIDWLVMHRDELAVVVAIGESAGRMRVVERLDAAGVTAATLIHPAAVVSETAVLSEGAIVGATAVLTSDARVGRHGHVGVGSIVSHDCVLEAFASLAPGCRLAGAVRVGRGAQLGVGTVVRDRVEIGDWSATGAGTVVVESVPADTTVIGVPARVVETRAPGWQREGPTPAGGGRAQPRTRTET